jgi:hypothetical protein
VQIYDNYSESQKAFCEKNGRVTFCPPFGDFLSTNEKNSPGFSQGKEMMMVPFLR